MEIIRVHYGPPVKGGTHPDNPQRKQILQEDAKKQISFTTAPKNLVIIDVEHHNATGGG